MDLKQIDVELSTQKEKKKPKGNNLLSTGVNDTISLSSMAQFIQGMMKHEKDQDKGGQKEKAKSKFSKTTPFRNLKPLEKKPTDKLNDLRVEIDLQEMLKQDTNYIQHDFTGKDSKLVGHFQLAKKAKENMQHLINMLEKYRVYKLKNKESGAKADEYDDEYEAELKKALADQGTSGTAP